MMPRREKCPVPCLALMPRTRPPDLATAYHSAVELGVGPRLWLDAEAQGERLVVPRLPGDDLPHVSTGADLRRLVEGRGSVSPRAIQLLRRALSGVVTPGRLRGLARLWLPLGRRGLGSNPHAGGRHNA